jgi:transglutaminase-like putative cysteine protease
MKRPLILHIFLFVVIIVVWVIVASASGAKPRIAGIAPAAAAPGELIVIQGRNFGDSRGRGSLKIAGEVPNRSDFQNWSDSRIVVRVPQDTPSGLVYVRTSNGTSNGALFRNSEKAPSSAPDAALGLPVVERVSPETLVIGEIVTIQGDHFGDIRGDSLVLFPAANASGARPLVEERDTTSPRHEERGYVVWTDTEIQVRVPEGIAAGELHIQTSWGNSRSIPVEVDRSAGRLSYAGARNVALQHEVEVSVSEDGDAPERVYFWMPRLRDFPEQRRVQRISHQGDQSVFTTGPLELYRLTEPAPGTTHRVRVTTLLDVYSVSSQVNTARLRTAYDAADPFVRHYTASSSLVPEDAAGIQSLAAQAGGAGGNPFKQARSLFDILIQELDPVPRVGNIDAVSGLSAGEGNAFTYASAFVAALRANGIPARRVAGQLLLDGGLVRHYWAEFFLYGIGWVPVDAALADGLHPGGEEANRYFAGHPADRVAYSKGVLETPPMIPDSERVQVPHMYFLAEHHEEVAGDPASYHITWRNVRLLGEY